jgi:hypothetical protein
MPVKKDVKKTPAKKNVKKTPTKDYIPRAASVKKTTTSKSTKASITSKTTSRKSSTKPSSTSDATFGGLLKQTWEQYRTNFRQLAKFQLLLIVPLLLIAINQIYWLLKDAAVLTFLENPEAADFLSLISTNYFTITLILSTIYFGAYLFTSAGLMSATAKNKPLKYDNFISEAKMNWVDYTLFLILTVFFLVLLFMALVIPGIIFMIYWMFAFYIYFDKKTTRIDALKQSKEMITGNWWRVLGYLLLLMLVFAAVGLVVALITTPIALAILAVADSQTELITGIILETIENTISILMTPFTVLFFRNFYFKMRK